MYFKAFPHFFKFLFLHSVQVGCLLLPFAPNHWSESCFLPFTIGALYIFLYFTLYSLHFFLYFCICTQSFLWAPWLPVFWTLHQIGCLSPCGLALFLEFWSVLSFGPYFLVTGHLLSCLGVGFRYSPGWGNPHCCFVALSVGEVSEREQCCSLALF